MFERKKKKIIWKIVLTVGPPLLVVVLVASGLFAVTGFVQSLFGRDDDKIEQQLDTMTLEELLSSVGDKKVITEETLDEMMIERKTLKGLLQRVYDYNHRDIVVEKEIEYIRTYTTYSVDEEGVETSEVHEERGWFPYEVHSATYEQAYAMDWQVAYALATFYAIDLFNEDDMDAAGSEGAPVVDSVEEKVFITGKTDYYETPYDDYFDQAAEITGVPVNLLKSFADAGSGFDPEYVDGTKRKRGVMRLTNVVADQYQVEDVFDPEVNILVGAQYMSGLLQRYQGDIALALAAYDTSISEVDGALGSPSIPNVSSVKILVSRTLINFTGLTYYQVYTHLNDYIMDSSVLTRFGTFKKGRLSLTNEEMDALIYDLMPKFYYYFDVVRDEQVSYTYEDCMGLPNDGLVSFGDASTEEGRYDYYEPHSLLDNVELANRDIVFEHDGNHVQSYMVYMRQARWQTIELKYWSNFDDDWLANLIAELPKGSEVLAKYESDVSGAVDDGAGGGGYYYTGDPYADVPLGANGMTRNWSMSENDIYLISLSDAETWNLLLGHGFTSRPRWGEYPKEWVPLTFIKVPIWVWDDSAADLYAKKTSWITLTVNSYLASTFMHVFQDIYNDPSQPVINPAATWTFNYRKVRGGSSYSSHSFGTAIDINASTYIPGTRWTHALVSGYNALPSKSEWAALPESRAKYELMYRDCPIVCIFKAYGFCWGADWSSKSDGMHFSFIGDNAKSVGQANHETYYK